LYLGGMTFLNEGSCDSCEVASVKRGCYCKWRGRVLGEVTQNKRKRSESPVLITVEVLQHRGTGTQRNISVLPSPVCHNILPSHRYIDIYSRGCLPLKSQSGIELLPSFHPSSLPPVAQASIISSTPLRERSFLSRRSEIPLLSCNQFLVLASLTLSYLVRHLFLQPYNQAARRSRDPGCNNHLPILTSLWRCG
jgi:hypothetical protein